MQAGWEVWRQLKRWAIENGLLTAKELEILEIAASMPRLLPTEKQSVVIVRALNKLRAEGCSLAAEIG